MPDSVQTIGAQAFAGCTKLTSLTLPFVGSDRDAECKEAILGYLFATDGATGNACTQTYQYQDVWIGLSAGSATYYFPQRLTEITITDASRLAYGALSGITTLKTVTLSDGIYELGAHAFDGCTSLTSVNIPQEVNTLSDSLFADCTSLAELFFGDNITAIGANTFSGCSALVRLCSYDDGTFSVGTHVKTVGEQAFAGCSSMTSLTLPDSLTQIGEKTFQNCTRLRDMTMPFVGSDRDGLASKRLSYLFGTVPSTLKTVTITDQYTIGQEAFRDCTSLTSVTLSEGVAIINKSAFNTCTALSEINLPESLEMVGEDAFANCDSLKTLKIPDNVTVIGKEAFFSCDNLRELTIGGKVTSIGSIACSWCKKLTDIYFGGTVEEWNDLVPQYSWSETGNYTVHCSDGDIAKN